MEMNPSASGFSREMLSTDRQPAGALTPAPRGRYSGSSVISIRSASPHKRSSA